MPPPPQLVLHARWEGAMEPDEMEERDLGLGESGRQRQRGIEDRGQRQSTGVGRWQFAGAFSDPIRNSGLNSCRTQRTDVEVHPTDRTVD